MARPLAFALLFLPLFLLHAGTGAESPVSTSLCELVKSPASFNGKLLTVRAPVQIGFESFGLSVSGCGDSRINYVWLEYGRGPAKQPTIWCCGDMVPRDVLPLEQTAEFRRFHRLLTAQKKSKDCANCYLYDVTATITGRFDAVETQACPGDAKSRCCSNGFGHFGMACGRIVIQSVAGVVATPAK